MPFELEVGLTVAHESDERVPLTILAITGDVVTLSGGLTFHVDEIRVYAGEGF